LITFLLVGEFVEPGKTKSNWEFGAKPQRLNPRWSGFAIPALISKELTTQKDAL